MNFFDGESVCASSRNSTLATVGFMVLFFVVSVVACVLRGPGNMTLLVDNQHYFFIAERAASGVPPHISQFDPKNALSLLISAVVIKASRLTGIGDDLAAARLISILFGSAAVAFVWLCTWMLTRRRSAAHLSAIVMLGFHLFFIMAVMGARPKVFLASFLILPIIATICARPFWAGVFSAMAFLCWQPALLVIGGAVVAILLEPSRARRDLIRLGLGLFVTVAAYEAYFVAHGALAEQFEQSYAFPRAYLTHGAAAMVWKIHAEWLFHVRNGFKLSSVVPVGFALAVLAMMIWTATHPRRALAAARANPGATHLVIVSAAALLFTFHDYQGFPDEFLVMPYMAVVWGSLLGAAITRLAKGGSPARKAVITVLVFALAAVPVADGLSGNKVPAELVSQRALARTVGGFLDRGASVYAVGCTHLLAFNRHDNFVPYGFFFRGMAAYMATKANSADGYRPFDERGRMPDIILESRGFIPAGEGWLETEYRDITTSVFSRQRIRVWERIDPARRWGEPVLSPSSRANVVRLR